MLSMFENITTVQSCSSLFIFSFAMNKGKVVLELGKTKQNESK